MAAGGSENGEFEKWKQWEYQQNKKFEDIAIKRLDVAVLNVEVLSGKNIANVFPANLIDAPNPQIILEYKAAEGPKIYRTTAKVDVYEPVWNECFTFIFPRKSDVHTVQDDSVMEIKLVDDSWMWSTAPLGEAELDTSKIEFVNYVEKEVSFGEYGTVAIRIGKEVKKESDLRLSLSLCEAEMNFRIKRIPKVMKKFHETLGPGAPQNLFETPIMSILGSGGAYRAMIGMCGVMEGLEKIGLLDCLTYAFGTSGSSWYLTSVYARKAFTGRKRRSYHSWLRKSFQTTFVREAVKVSNISKCKKVHRRKSDTGQPFTLVDFYGICVTNKIVGKKFAALKLSDLKAYVETAGVPYLILNASQVLDRHKVWQYRADCSFSPHEVEIPHYAVNVDTSTLNSEYHSGIVGRKLPEPDLSFILGTLGSVLAVSLNRMLGIDHYDNEEILENAGNPEFFQPKEEHSSTFWESVLRWLSHLPSFRDRNALIERTGKVLNVARGYDNMTRFPMNPMTSPVPEDIDGFSEREEVLSVVDGGHCHLSHGCHFGIAHGICGILCNVAVDAALRPQRRNDILFVCDFSFYGDEVGHKTLENAMKLAEEGGYKFPPVDIEKIKAEELRELYIFEDENDPDCPTVFWLMMSTKKFKEEQNYRPRNIKVLSQLESGEKFTDFKIYESDSDYGTFNSRYSELEFERLRELMFFNVITNEEVKVEYWNITI